MAERKDFWIKRDGKNARKKSFYLSNVNKY